MIEEVRAVKGWFRSLLFPVYTLIQILFLDKKNERKERNCTSRLIFAYLKIALNPCFISSKVHCLGVPGNVSDKLVK